MLTARVGLKESGGNSACRVPPARVHSPPPSSPETSVSVRGMNRAAVRKLLFLWLRILFHCNVGFSAPSKHFWQKQTRRERKGNEKHNMQYKNNFPLRVIFYFIIFIIIIIIYFKFYSFQISSFNCINMHYNMHLFDWHFFFVHKPTLSLFLVQLHMTVSLLGNA